MEFKNCLLARMQYKGQGYMMLKDTTCKITWKLILPMQMSPCGIMDLSLASYKFSPLHKLIYNPLSSLSRTITTCKLLWSSFCSYKLMLAFGPLNSPPLVSNTKRKTLVAQGRVKLCDPLCVEWNRSQNLTLTLYRLSSP